MIEATLKQLVQGNSLSVEQANGCLMAVMGGECSEAEIAALLTALHIKGETVDEIVGAAQAMRTHATRIQCDARPLLDTCGTGGSGTDAFNISTAAALTVSACGVTVAKHGNRGITSTSGSANVLAVLGVNVEADVGTVEKCLAEVGIGFCFAPLLHGAMKHAMPVRRALGFPTIFNLLGPLTNPAGANCQVLGVSERQNVSRHAHALHQLGCECGYVVHGEDGLDEVTLGGVTFVGEVTPDGVTEKRLTPDDFGLPTAPVSTFTVTSAEQSAERIGKVIDGQTGPDRDIVLANAALGLMAAGAGVVSPAEGVQIAAAAIDRGEVRAKLDALIRASNGNG